MMMMTVGSMTEMPFGMEILHNLAAMMMESKFHFRLWLLFSFSTLATVQEGSDSESLGYFTFFILTLLMVMKHL